MKKDLPPLAGPITKNPPFLKFVRLTQSIKLLMKQILSAPNWKINHFFKIDMESSSDIYTRVVNDRNIKSI